MEFNFGNQFINKEPSETNVDLPIIEVRYIKDLDMYYILHNTGNASIKLHDTPDKEEANDMARTFTSLYSAAYLDGLGYAIYDITAAAELYDDLTAPPQENPPQ